jgi:hypothetical protein
MYRDANVDAQADDAQFPIVDISDDALERMAAGDQINAVNTAFCTQWWVCPT